MGDLTGVKLFEGSSLGSNELLLDFAVGHVVTPFTQPSAQLHLQANVTRERLPALTAFRSMYLIVETLTTTGPALRGTLEAADHAVLLTRLTAASPEQTGSGIGAIHLVAAREPRGRLTSTEITFDLDYSGLAAGNQVVGARLTAGPGRELGFALAARPAAATAGNLRIRFEVALNQAAADIVTGLLRNPGEVTLELQTINQGALQGRLHGTDRVTFFPKLAAPARVTFHTLREQSGAATAGIAVLDPAYGGEGIATVAGPGGQIFVSRELEKSAPFTFLNLSDLTGLNGTLRMPDQASFQLAGTKAMLATASLPVASTVISAVWDPTYRAIAPGGLFTIFGRHLTQAAGDLAGLLGTSVPTSLNGTSVLIAGRSVPLLDVRPDHVIAQVPIDLAAGNHPILVRTSAGDSAPVMALVAPAAPAVFFSQATREGNVVKVHKSDGSEVSRENPARPGEILLFFSTGFGARTVPAIRSGETAPLGTSVRSPLPVVTIGNRPAPVVYSVLAPGLVGIVQTAVRMPQAAGSGNIPLVVTVGGARSNPVILFAALR